MIALNISKEQFLEEHFERSPYFQPAAVSSVDVNWSELSSTIYSWDLANGGFILHENGVVPQPAYSERYQDVELMRLRLVPKRVEEMLSRGATLVLNRLERKILSIGRLCAELAALTNEKTVANGYIAFGGTGTFGKHWDTHDVFAVQLLGSKLWRVYEPTHELPLPNQKSRDHKQECPNEPVIEQIMRPGDILYLPRGWWHEAIPLADTPTFHIAAGIHTAKTLDYVQWALQEAMPQFLEARKTISLATPDTSRIQDLLVRMANELMDPGLIERFIGQMKLMGTEYQPVDLNRLV